MSSNRYLDVATDRELIVVRWKDTSAKAFESLTPVLREARARAGAPLFYVGIVDAHFPPLDERMREVAQRSLEVENSLLVSSDLDGLVQLWSGRRWSLACAG